MASGAVNVDDGGIGVLMSDEWPYGAHAYAKRSDEDPGIELGEVPCYEGLYLLYLLHTFGGVYREGTCLGVGLADGLSDSDTLGGDGHKGYGLGLHKFLLG